jgi:hypothetical protein
VEVGVAAGVAADRVVHPPALPQEVHKEEAGEAGEVQEDPHNYP